MAKVIEFVSDHLERRKRIQDRLGEMITFELQRPGQWSGTDLEILGSLNAVVPDGKIASTVIYDPQQFELPPRNCTGLTSMTSPVGSTT